MTVSNNAPAATNVTYNFQFTIPTTGSMDSIVIQFCANSALVEDTCNAPVGFDASSASVTSQSGLSGFTLSSSGSTVNSLLLTHAPGNIQVAGPVSVTFSGITNPTNANSFYSKIFTFSTTDGSGSYIDFGALAFAIMTGYDVSAEVPPFLTFCEGTAISGFDCATATGDQIDLGQLSSAASSTATSLLVASTNAANGYNISLKGITMTSGNNVLPAMADQVGVVGTSQFGINLRANTTPPIGQEPSGPGSASPTSPYGATNHFSFQDGDVIAHAASAQDYKRYTVSYLVNVSKDQAPGVYSTTITYICTGSF